MEKLHYQSPVFNFQELRLMERVAERCWGTSETWYDGNGDGDFTDSGDVFISLDELGLGKHGCKGQNAANALNEKYPFLKATANDAATKNTRYSIAGS